MRAAWAAAAARAFAFFFSFLSLVFLIRGPVLFLGIGFFLASSFVSSCSSLANSSKLISSKLTRPCLAVFFDWRDVFRSPAYYYGMQILKTVSDFFIQRVPSSKWYWKHLRINPNPSVERLECSTKVESSCQQKCLVTKILYVIMQKVLLKLKSMVSKSNSWPKKIF